MVTKDLNPLARASATSVSFRQKQQNTAAQARPEKIVVIGNYQEGKEVETGKLLLASGNADDAGIIFGFGSPLHRMAKKLYPTDRNGAKVEVYYLPIKSPDAGAKHKISADVSGVARKNFTAYLRYNELEFEAAADVAGKVATNTQLNPAKDPRRLNLNIFNKIKVPFTVVKGMAQDEILKSIKASIEESVDVPFICDLNIGEAKAAILKGAQVNVANLNADDYSIALEIGGELINETIGTVNVATASDLITLINGLLDDATISATTPGAVTTSFALETGTIGANAAIKILDVETGTNLFETLGIIGESHGSDAGELTLTAKWTGETSEFEVDFVDQDNNVIKSADYGIEFDTSIISEAAGVVKLGNFLKNITTNYGITRVVSQFSDTDTLDVIRDYFQAFRNDGLIAQYVLCYTGKKYPESELVPRTVDLQKLVEYGNKRRDDAINVLITADYGDLRALEYSERDLLLKSGISNIEKRIESGWRIGDLVTFYHPVGNSNPLFQFDRNVALLGNVAYDLMNFFDKAEEWRSIILIGDKDVTSNPAARSTKDIRAAVNTRLLLMGIAGWIADAQEAVKRTIVEIDADNPNRVNINPDFDLTGVGRIYDIVNFVGFFFGNNN